MRSSGSAAAAVVGFAFITMLAPGVGAQSAKADYTEALGREDVLRSDLGTQRGGVSAPLVRRIRMLVGEYEDLARRYPRSGYSDNALYHGAVLSADAFWQFGDEPDRRTALRLFRALRSGYPASSLVSRIGPHTARLEAAARPVPSSDEASTLKAIRREALTDTLRVVLELERETPYHDERLDGPPRVFIDLQNVRASAELRDATFGFPDDLVRQVRVGRQQGATRVVLDLRGTARHSVYALYNPYRVVIDFDRPALSGGDAPATAVAAPKTGTAARSAAAPQSADARSAESLRSVDTRPVEPPAPSAAKAYESANGQHGATAVEADSVGARRASEDSARTAKDAPGATWAPEPPPVAPEAAGVPRSETRAPDPLPATPAPPSAPAPAPATTNSRGGFSLSRQLGLGISRVVIDAGHGGHDPGARVKGLNEADVTLDVALRVEKLLLQVPGVEVTLTRRTNVYIPLEERTAIANRAGADLFLSIHVNAAVNPRLRGIETYFLNFAPSKEAEAIAARENAGSSRTMNNLPDIVKAIALNNKIDESRDFAALVQAAMFDRLRRANREARNLGVKQAPFMVLIGATMPSVLAEISFLTNRQEASLLKTPAYRQAIADALVAGISKYQRSLKGAQAVAAQ